MKTFKGILYGIAIAIAVSAGAATVYNYFPPPGMTYSPTTGFVVGSATGGAQGAGTVNAQGVFVNGAAVVTGSGLPVGANPTGTVGLTAVNGSATTFLRSDGAPPLSQAIAPTWTGSHLFNGATNATSVGTSGVSIGQRSSLPALQFTLASNAANARVWEVINTSTTLRFSAMDDTLTTAKPFLTATRSGNVITDASFGNVTDNPTYSFLGTGQVSIGGGTVVGSPTGGNQGAGTINMQGCFVNGVACSTGGAAGANPTGTVGLTTVNGVAGTYMRSDAAPPLSQAIVPTWTGLHTFSLTSAQIAAFNTTNATGGYINFSKSGTNAGYVGTGGASLGPGAVTDFVIRADANLIFASGGGTSRVQLGTAGNVTINAPSSGNTLTVNQFSSAPGLVVSGSGTISRTLDTGAHQSVIDINATNTKNVLNFSWLTTATPAAIQVGAVDVIGLSTAGNVTINAPTSGNSLAVTGLANNYAQTITAPNTANQSFGMSMQAGSSASDVALQIANASNVNVLFKVFGDGGVAVGNPTGGDKGLGTLNIAGVYYQNGTPVIQTGTFTATLTGMTATVTGTMGYAVAGATCTIWVTGGGISGTSNATTFTITGLPAVCTPAISNGVMFGDTTNDNGIAAAVGVAEVGSNGVITLGILQNGASRPQLNNSGWTASGAKSLNSDFVITFHL